MVEEQIIPGFPCITCGQDVTAEADKSAEDKTFEFTCPNCGTVDHI